jgi:hypothetical protein
MSYEKPKMLVTDDLPTFVLRPPAGRGARMFSVHPQEDGNILLRDRGRRRRARWPRLRLENQPRSAQGYCREARWLWPSRGRHRRRLYRRSRLRGSDCRQERARRRSPRRPLRRSRKE